MASDTAESVRTAVYSFCEMENFVLLVAGWQVE